jgi:hypothetical protein
MRNCSDIFSTISGKYFPENSVNKIRYTGNEIWCTEYDEGYYETDQHSKSTLLRSSLGKYSRRKGTWTEIQNTIIP